MATYRIYFEEGEVEDILRILRSTDDVTVDVVNSKSVSFTIRHGKPNRLYRNLVDRIDQQVYAFRPHHGYITGG
jgi:hypothetical protein